MRGQPPATAGVYEIATSCVIAALSGYTGRKDVIMTRKQYTRRVVSLVTRMARDNNNSIGEATRYARDHVRMAIKECGSYQAAWREIVKILSPLYPDLR